MRVAVLCVSCNDPLIYRMIESVPKEWDIILVDGNFNDSEAELMSDAMIASVSQYPNVKLHHKAGLEYQVRNKYLEESKGYDYGLMLDSDEYIEQYDKGVFTACLSSLNQGYYLIDMMFGDELRQQGRFFVEPFAWRYHQSHKYIIKNGEQMAIFHAKKPAIKGIQIRHDDSERPEQLKQYIEEYQKDLWKYESTTLYAKP